MATACTRTSSRRRASSSRRWARSSQQSSVVDRLLGRERTLTPAWVSIGPNRRFIELPPDGLGELSATFRTAVAARLDPPWAATAATLRYLAEDVINVYLRGDAAGGHPPDWYVQLTFSGCAGLTETSAALAVHWAERWYARDAAALEARYLVPNGFQPDGRVEPSGLQSVFVPVGDAGYALASPSPRDAEAAIGESRYFELDAAALDAIDDRERAAALSRLDRELPRRLSGGSCCCQWCAPDFDAASCDGIVART